MRLADRPAREALQAVYDKLFAAYGPQHWWPARSPFEVIVGAILTQSAAWTNVEKAINNLREANLLSPAALRTTPSAEVGKLIHACGYYNAKALKLKAFAAWLGERHHDSLLHLFSGTLENVRDGLLSVYGIGQETADSILLYAGNRPIFVIDAYTRRVMGRVGLHPERDSYAGYQELFMENLPADPALFNEYHALLVNLAKNVCRPQPNCGGCCLGDVCEICKGSRRKP